MLVYRSLARPTLSLILSLVWPDMMLMLHCNFECYFLLNDSFDLISVGRGASLTFDHIDCSIELSSIWLHSSPCQISQLIIQPSAYWRHRLRKQSTIFCTRSLWESALASRRYELTHCSPHWNPSALVLTWGSTSFLSISTFSQSFSWDTLFHLSIGTFATIPL